MVQVGDLVHFEVGPRGKLPVSIPPLFGVAIDVRPAALISTGTDIKVRWFWPAEATARDMLLLSGYIYCKRIVLSPLNEELRRDLPQR